MTTTFKNPDLVASNLFVSDPFIHGLLNECSQDPLLHKFLEERIVSRLPWPCLTAVGGYVRLRRHSKEFRTMAIFEILEGRIPEALDRERRWFAGLDKSIHDMLFMRALTSIESFHRRIQELEVLLASPVKVSMASMKDVLILRDDIESGLLLFSSIGRCDSLRAALKHADELGEELSSSIFDKFDFSVIDQLCRAAISNPDGWWTRIYPDEDGDSYAS